MNLFETTALAAGAGAPGANAGIINLVMLGGFVLIFYFLLIYCFAHLQGLNTKHEYHICDPFLEFHSFEPIKNQEV